MVPTPPPMPRARRRRLRSRGPGGIRAVRPVSARAAHDPARERHAPARRQRRRSAGASTPPRICAARSTRSSASASVPMRSSSPATWPTSASPRRTRRCARRSSRSPSGSARRSIWVAGNHDERPALRRDLLDLEPTEEPVTGVWDLGGLRLIALDTTVPGWHHGDLDDAQLDWLRGRAVDAGAARNDPRHAPPAAAVARPAVRHPRTARSGPPRRGDRRHRRARDPRGPPALLDERHVRRASRSASRPRPATR